jgi:predicted O-methyltransferase YrrM
MPRTPDGIRHHLPVKTASFLERLSGAFDDFPRSELPRDVRFAEILEAVPGLARANNLALLNVAAGRLDPGESYVEVGTYHGSSLIAAMLENDADFVALDNWSLGDGSREQLDRNLARFELAGRPTLIEGDAFDTLRSGALEGRRVGVYYYDNGHEYEQQLDGMRLIEPYLVDGALVIVDDTDWERVERAVDDYLTQQPQATELLSIDGKDRGHPEWWEGMRVLRWSKKL